MTLPLEGIRVVELSHMVMGPSCGMILADLGAEVIKVEPRGAGDKTRLLPGSGSGLFATFNRNKKSVQLNISDPTDIQSLLAIMDTADVLVENFRSGKMESYGLGYETLKERNPGLVYCSLKGFLPGPYGNRSALDEVVQMLGGLAYMTGPPGQPLRAGASVNDIMGGMFGVIGIQGALRSREVDGVGAHLTSSLFENNAFLVGSHMVQAQLSGETPPPMPNRMPAWAVYDIFRASNDDLIFIAAVTDTQFQAMCREFGLVDLAADPALTSNQGRVDARDRIHASIQSRLRHLPLEEVEKTCDAAELSYARVNTPSDLIDDPHLAHTGGLADTHVPGSGDTMIPLLPLLMDGKRLEKRMDVPAPGQHNAEVLGHLDTRFS